MSRLRKATQDVSTRGRSVPGKVTRGRNGRPSVVQRQDGRWSVTVDLGHDAHGKRRRYQSTRATEQEALEAGMRAALTRTELRADVARDLTVSQLLDHYAASRPPSEHSTQANRAWEQALIARHIGTLRLRQVNVERVAHLLTALGAEGKAPSTVAKCRRLLHAAFRHAVAQGLLTHSPVPAVPPPLVRTRVREEAWTREEVARIVQAASNIRLYPLFLTLLATGARVGELIGTRLEDYDPRTGVLRIEGTAKRGGGRGRGKTEAAHRACQLPERVQQVLDTHLEGLDRARAAAGPFWGQRQVMSAEVRCKQRAASRQRAAHPLPEGWRPQPPPPAAYEPLFPTGNGTPWLPGNVGKAWRQVLQQAGLPHRRLHSTRSAFITAALQDRSVGLADIQAAVGHTSPVMTMRYAQSVRGAQARVAGVAARGLGLDGGTEEE